MRTALGRYALISVLTAAALLWSGKAPFTSVGDLSTTAEARIGRPATPVSYAGVARRTTVRVATPGVGYGGPANRGGPVNRVGRL